MRGERATSRRLGTSPFLFAAGYTEGMARDVGIRKAIVERMAEEARGAAPQECCGLLAGREGVISQIFPAANVLASATEFEIAPVELFRIFRAMREAGLEHMGIYHSHPRGMNIPSPTDVKRAYYSDAAYFIISALPQVAQPVRAFRIRDGRFTELAVSVQAFER